MAPCTCVVHRTATWRVLLASLMASLMAPCTCISYRIVNTSLGDIRGTQGHGWASFLGIPYASIPARFAPSEAHQPWAPRILDALAYGPACMQGQTFLSVEEIPVAGMSEDCLSLNIWIPTTRKPREKAPVMLFIHGGGFKEGSGAMGTYRGQRLAHEHGVVVVTINYRLGAFGALVHSEFKSLYNRTGGMNALHDQILALQWVQQHIEKFQGDPTQVTLFGESAGALSVCMLAASPLMRGKNFFKRIIMESGPCNGAWGPASEVEGALASDLEISQLPGWFNHSLSDLRSVDPMSLVNMTVMPSLDGLCLAEDPLHAWKAGDLALPEHGEVPRGP